MPAGATARRRLARATGQGDEAISWQRRLGWLEELDSYYHVLERPWVDRSWLIVLPGAAESERVIIPVARGRVLERRTVSWRSAGWSTVVEDACYAVRLRELQAESVFQPVDLTPSLIVTKWLEEGAPGGRAFDLDELAAGQVVRELEALEAATGPEPDPFTMKEPAPIQCVA